LSKRYQSLFQKWDLYIPFMELGAFHYLAPKGCFAMIVPYPVTNQLYARELRRMFTECTFLTEVVDLKGTKIFENATVTNCIVFSQNTAPGGKTIISHIDEYLQIRHSYVLETRALEQDPERRIWNLTQDERTAMPHADLPQLGDLCYISVGMVLNSNENSAKGEFKKDDLISLQKDTLHPRRYIEAKDIARYQIKRVRYLEYGTERCPGQLRRPTFPQLYDREKILVNSMGEIAAYYDNGDFFLHNHSLICLIPWWELKGVDNKSIAGTISKYCSRSRSEMEELSQQISLSYLLGLMNSKYMMYLLTLLRSGASNIYPDFLRKLPIPIANKDLQESIGKLAMEVMNKKRESAEQDTIALENEIESLVRSIYGV